MQLQIENHQKVITDAGGLSLRNWLPPALFVALLVTIADCHSATFNWPTTPVWTNTQPASGTTAVGDYAYNAAGSINATVTNNGETYVAAFPQVVTSAAQTGVNGGFTGQQNLMLSTSTTAATTSYSSITINFLYRGGATNVSFMLYDVDFGGNTSFIDQISNISAAKVGGGTVYAQSVVGSTGNSVTGSGSTFTVTGTGPSNANDPAGNVSITFTPTDAISSLTFRWANIAPTTRTTQNIAVSPINFVSVGTAFPEVNSSLAALLVCGGVMGLGRFRKHSRNSEGSHLPAVRLSAMPPG